MVKRGSEVDLEYSKKDIINKMNSFFGYQVVEKLKLKSFENEIDSFSQIEDKIQDVAIKRLQDNKI